MLVKEPNLWFDDESYEWSVAAPPVRSSPAERVVRVRVASWPDGAEMWRVLRSPGEVHRGIPLFRFDDPQHWVGSKIREDEHHSPFGWVRVQSLVDRDLLGKERWAMVELGLVPRGLSPFPLSATLSPENPYVGRFHGRTIDEVRADAEAVDQWIGEVEIPNRFVLFDSMPISAPRLFSGWTRMLVRRDDLRGIDEVEVQRPNTIDSDGRVTAWNSAGKARVKSVSAAVDWMMNRDQGQDQDHPWWFVLPADDADRWWEEHSESGSLTLPPDETEVYRMVGERFPYLWGWREVATLAIEQWGR